MKLAGQRLCASGRSGLAEQCLNELKVDLYLMEFGIKLLASVAGISAAITLLSSAAAAGALVPACRVEVRLCNLSAVHCFECDVDGWRVQDRERLFEAASCACRIASCAALWLCHTHSASIATHPFPDQEVQQVAAFVCDNSIQAGQKTSARFSKRSMLPR